MKKLIFALPALSIILALVSCGGARVPATVTDVSGVFGAKIGAASNDAGSKYAARYGELYEYASYESMLGDLSAGVIDCAFADMRVSAKIAKQGRGIRALDEALFSAELRIAAAKESAGLMNEINAVLAAIREDGTLVRLAEAYVDGKNAELPGIPEIAYVTSLRLAVPEEGFLPFSGQDEYGSFTGLDIYLARIICARLGVELTVLTFPHDQLIDAVRFGKADFAMGGLYDDGNNAELADFSSPYYTLDMAVMVRK
ncbi:MAG: transporter substrate-binding domain-containing protein [Oscillospiraceae bacterium]|nr:transporter substrate-binding domain-containing protein [Oscillospiraceae bacterium]